MYKIITLLLFTFLVLSPQIMDLDTNGLVGAWLMDESNGNTVSDVTPVEPIGKLATTWSQIKIGFTK